MFEWLSIFTQLQTWLDLLVLMFLEIALGVDNLVFIVITSDRLPERKQHIGRKLGLAAALFMRILLLCCITWVMSLHSTIFTLDFLPGDKGQISVRDLILLVGGIYLMFKGFSEIRHMFTLEDVKESFGELADGRKTIGLGRAIGTIMVMDVVFSLDSVITAVGLVGQLPVMIIAVLAAVLVMMAFIDPISTFINDHSEIKILALAFIFLIGALLVGESVDLDVPKSTVYFAMAFALVLEIIQMFYNRKVQEYRDQVHAQREAQKASAHDDYMIDSGGESYIN